MPVKDITGLRSGMLEAVKFACIDAKGHALWLCRCDCGNEKIMRSSSIVNQSSKSCGCNRFKKRDECKICSEPVPADSKYIDFCCDECKQAANKINSLRFKHKGCSAIMKGKKAGLSPLDKLLADLRAYNEKNGTHLSYGQYVHLIEGNKDNKKSSPA